MSESRNVLKLDIGSLTEFQRDLHLPTDKPKVDGKLEEVDSRFSSVFEKTSWSSHTKVAMSRKEGERSTVHYTASKKFDFLFKCEMRAMLPELRVKEEYGNKVEICWPHKPGHNLIADAQLLLDDDPVNSFDNVWLDIRSQWFADPGQGKRETYNRMIGSIDFLTQWTTFLPEFPITVMQPFFYTMHESRALPLYMSSMNNINHVYTLRTDLAEILRMRVQRKDGSHKEIEYQAGYLVNPKPIPTPELWGRFAQVTDAERNWHKKEFHTLYIDDVQSTKSTNPVGLGSKVTIPLHALTPCKGIFWVAENIDSSDKNNRSNYTTDPDDINRGWNPCATAGIKYTGGQRVNELPQDHFDRSEGMHFCPSTPEEAGYNCYILSYNLVSLNAETGIVLEGLNAELSLHLANTDPFRNANIKENKYDELGEIIPVEAMESNSEAKKSCKFTVHVKMLVMKKLTVQWNQTRQRIEYKIIDDATALSVFDAK